MSDIYLEFSDSQEPKKGAALAALISDVQYKKDRHKGAISSLIEDQAAGQVAEYLDGLVASADTIKAKIDEQDCCTAVLFVGGEMHTLVLRRGKNGTIEVEVGYQIVSKACTSDAIAALAYDYDAIRLSIPFRGFVGDLYRAMLLSYSHPLRISDYRQ